MKINITTLSVGILIVTFIVHLIVTIRRQTIRGDKWRQRNYESFVEVELSTIPAEDMTVTKIACKHIPLWANTFLKKGFAEEDEDQEDIEYHFYEVVAPILRRKILEAHSFDILEQYFLGYKDDPEERDSKLLWSIYDVAMHNHLGIILEHALGMDENLYQDKGNTVLAPKHQKIMNFAQIHVWKGEFI